MHLVTCLFFSQGHILKVKVDTLMHCDSQQTDLSSGMFSPCVLLNWWDNYFKKSIMTVYQEIQVQLPSPPGI